MTNTSVRTPDRAIVPEKAALIDSAAERYAIRSIVDLGGCFAVHGRYTFRAVRRHAIERAVIVDARITPRTQRGAQRFAQVELLEGQFDDPAVVGRIGEVDAAIMFDVLLHQVAPDWDQLLALYAGIDTLVIYNQNWLGPDTVRFVDLGVDAYLQRVPHTNAPRIRGWFARHDQLCEPQGKRWRDVYNFWQWGITEKDLVGVLWDLGYRIELLRNYGQFDARFPDVEVVGLIAHKRDRPLHARPAAPGPRRTTSAGGGVASGVADRGLDH